VEEKVEQLRSRHGNLRDGLETLRGRIEDLEEDVEENRTRTETLREAVNGILRGMQRVPSLVNPLSGTDALTFSD
jgi:uncharacterized membrane protein